MAWFDSKDALRSGWAWGQHYLEGGTAAVEAQIGKGKVFLFGPEITFRAQPHGTFKFLFNSIYYGTSVPAAAGTTTTTAHSSGNVSIGERTSRPVRFTSRWMIRTSRRAYTSRL